MARRAVLLQPDDQRRAHVMSQGFFQLEDSFVCLAVTRMNAPECVGLSVDRVRDGIATVGMIGGGCRELEPRPRQSSCRSPAGPGREIP